MSAEKMKILQMLEEGKITSDEASKLLQSIGNSGTTSSASSRSADKPSGGLGRNMGSPSNSNSSSYGSDSRYASGAGNNQRPPGGNSAGGDGVNFDEYAKEFGRKIETLARDLEPHIQKLAGVVVEKTATVADRVSKSMQESARTTSYTPPAPPKPAAPSTQGMVERNFEMIVSGGYNEINLSAMDGRINVKGYNGDKITAKVLFRPKKAGVAVDFIKLGSKYCLNYDEDEFKSVAIEALIPESMFKNMVFQTTNGDVDVATIQAENILISNMNGKIEVSGVQAEALKIDNSNGKVILSHINSAYVQVENSNSEIRMDMFDISKMKVSTFNAAVSMTVASLAKYNEYVWVVETSNAKLSVNTPTAPDYGYHLKAQTTLGNVKFGLTGLNFLVNDSNYVEAKSINYDTCRKKIDLSMETSSSQIVVN